MGQKLGNDQRGAGIFLVELQGFFGFILALGKVEDDIRAELRAEKTKTPPKPEVGNKLPETVIPVEGENAEYIRGLIGKQGDLIADDGMNLAVQVGDDVYKISKMRDSGAMADNLAKDLGIETQK